MCNQLYTSFDKKKYYLKSKFKYIYCVVHKFFFFTLQLIMGWTFKQY